MTLREAIEAAQRQQPWAIPLVGGFTSNHVRRLLHNVCAPEAVYLEIGVGRGATLISAGYRNQGTFVGVDNWSQFDFAEAPVRQNLTQHAESMPGTVALVSGDCWEPATVRKACKALGKDRATVYFYDGDHAEWAQARGITDYAGLLAPEAILLVDDWNWPETREGTRRGIAEAGLTIVEEHELFTPERQNGCAGSWWNGIGAFVVRR